MEKPFLIAEIGINHNGDIKIAKQLIDEAVVAGFDAVKFQKRDVNLVYSKEILDTPRESPWGNTTREQKNGLELNSNDYKEIDKFCKQKNIDWFASAWDLNSIKFLRNFNLKYNKIASAMIVDKIFLEEVSKEKKYTFISTGMSTLKDIELAVDIFKKNHCPFELMHSVSTYPMAVEDANLLTINALKKHFKCKVGYSGHEPSVSPSIIAACLGATSIERHITLNRAMYGSDQAASLEKKGLEELVAIIRKIPIVIGDKEKNIFECEIEVAKKLRYWEK